MKSSDVNRLAQLRSRAEVVLEAMGRTGADELAIKDISAVVHDLAVHQIELEMQNEELLNAQTELQRTQKEYQDLYHHAPVGYLTLNQQGMILRYNQTFSAMMENDDQKFIGKPFSNFVTPEDRDIFLARYKAFFKNPKGKNFDLRLSLSDGNLFWVRLTGHLNVLPPTQEDTSPILLLTVADINREKLAEDERHIAEQKIQQIQRLESIGTLAGGIAHDFNNMLAGLCGSVSLAKLKLRSDHPVLPILENAEQSIDRATQLTNQLLTFAKGGEPVRQVICMKNFVEEIVHFNLSGSSVKPVFDMEDSLWFAHVDQGQIQQVLANLTINARQAMSGGGHLYVTVRNVEIPANSLADVSEGKYLKIEVVDEGPGIPQSLGDRIFDPFFTTKEAGHGLGLTTVYSIVKRHGGHIAVNSSPHGGAIFTLLLPASTIDVAKKENPSDDTSSPENRSVKILVMDDEDMVRTMISAMLEELGHEVSEAEDDRQAIEKYRKALEAGNPFDLAILDLTIPGGRGGEQVVRDILKMNEDAKVIVSSGYANNPIMANYTDYGFKAVIGKPFGINKLSSVLTEALGNNEKN